MDLDYVEKLIGLVSRSSIAELEIERDGVRIRIARRGASFAPPVEASARPVSAGGAAEVPSAGGAAPAAGPHSIRAPLTGVFYRSAAEGEPPLVSVGDVVEEGQKIGVLEAMKTFNVVEADRSGRIVEIAFEDRSAVQSGDVLFVMEDAG